MRELIRSAQVMGALAVGMTPEVLDEKTAPKAAEKAPEKAPEPPAPAPPLGTGLPGPGHPERPVPHVPPTAEERSLWSRLR
ncbi:DUF6059 family protein [Streptomyces sp. NPDC004539]|uniref:DUF6059 family protein n=1 Tax=Streptomyces sp. NPDC004539 TaxID=3154280 RepID=UPI0033A99E00